MAVPEVGPVPARAGDPSGGFHFRVRCGRECCRGELHAGVRDLLGLDDGGVDSGHVPVGAGASVTSEGTDQASECVSLAFVEQFALPRLRGIGGHHFVALLAS